MCNQFDVIAAKMRVIDSRLFGDNFVYFDFYAFI
jgi:hypothetical protein